MILPTPWLCFWAIVMPCYVVALVLGKEKR